MKKLFKDKGKSQEGVTILTLVITIIVIIILAVIGIAGSMGAIDEAAIADYKNELKSVEVSVSAKRINNQKGGIGEEFKEEGFIPIIIENPPEDFVSFGEGDFYGYIVDLEYVSEDSTKRGSDYKKYEEAEAGKTITFGKNGKDNDVYIYDAMGKVFYAKGYYVEGGIYYSDILTQDGPIISIEKVYDETANEVNLTITVEPEIDGTNLRLDINGDQLTKEADETYKYTVTSNGTYIVTAEEDYERKAKKRVGVTEIKDINYTITYNLMYEGKIETQIKSGNTPIRLKGYKRDGYILEGWSRNPAASSVDFMLGEKYTENTDIELYAVWSQGVAREFVVTYNANGGSNAPEPDIKVERVILELSSNIPTRNGYLFKGWSKSSTSEEVDYNPGDEYTEEADIVLFAVWEEGEIKVELSVNPLDAGEAVGGGVKEAGRIVYITAVAKPGYSFTKWTVLTAGVNLDNAYAETTRFTMPNGTVQITANFKETEYDYIIKYNANGGTGVPNTQYKKHGEAINISTMIPSRSGYEFKGWTDTLSSQTVKYITGQLFEENRNVTLYAVWERNTEEFTLTFDANGGTNAPKPITKVKDTVIEIPVEEPDNNSLIFLGWNEDKNAKEAKYGKNQSYKITQNQTLYAIWSDTEKPVITITAAEENKNLVLYGNVKDDGGIVKYLWTDTYYKESEYNNIQWTNLSEARKETSLKNNVMNSGIHYFYAIDGDGNISYESIEVYRLSFIANGARVDVKYKAAGFDASLTDIVPARESYAFDKWRAESDGRIYEKGEKYLLNKNENFEATWADAIAFVPSTNRFFLTVQDAVDSIPTDCTDYVLVELLKSKTTDGVQIVSGQKVSLETEDKILSAEQTAINIEAGAAFKLVGGTINSDNYAIRNFGTFEIAGGTINAKYGIYNSGHTVIGDESIAFSRDSAKVNATTASYVEASNSATLHMANGSLVDSQTTYEVPTSGMTLRENFELRKIKSTSSVITTIVENLIMTSVVTKGTTAKPVEVTVTLSGPSNNYTFQYSTDNATWYVGNSVALIDNATVYGRILEGSEVANTAQLTVDNISNLTVSFDSAGGSAAESIEVKYNRTYNTISPLPTPTRTDYNFLGWFKEASGGTQVKDSDVVTATEDHTLHAQWKSNNQAPNVPTVTYSSKTATSFTVTAVSTDSDGDNIIYKLYVGGSLKATSSSTASGTRVTLQATGLKEATTYNYYVTVTDAKGAVSTSTTYSVTTTCPGNTVWGCSIVIWDTSIDCASCYGDGDCSHNDRGDSTTISSASDQTCPDCGLSYMSATTYKCPGIGCGATGTWNKCTKCGRYIDRWDGNHSGKCDECGGTGKGRYYCTEHDVKLGSENESHCEHGYTSSH